MTNAEAINELQSAIDLIKQDGKDWLDERDIPILEMAISALQAQEWVYKLIVNGDSIMDMAINALQADIVKCKDCKHLQKLRSEESAKKFGQVYGCARFVPMCPEDFCSRAERRTNEID